MKSTVTDDLGRFGYREKAIASDLLKAYAKNPPDFLSDEVKVFFNTNSGFVFLSDSDYNVGMLVDGKIEQFFSCTECGLEGFKNELLKDGKNCCKKYVKEALT